MTDFQTVRYELPGNGVARIVLAREPQRNAQDKRMTYELNWRSTWRRGMTK